MNSELSTIHTHPPPLSLLSASLKARLTVAPILCSSFTGPLRLVILLRIMTSCGSLSAALTVLQQLPVFCVKAMELLA